MRVRMVPPGTPVRHSQHPELTGRIKTWEWKEPGVLSAIPYSIAWDDSRRAADVLGWMFVYATPDSVEPISV